MINPEIISVGVILYVVILTMLSFLDIALQDSDSMLASLVERVCCIMWRGAFWAALFMAGMLVILLFVVLFECIRR
jgi:hypothetical protein